MFLSLPQHLLHPLKTLVAAIEGKEPGAEELGKRFVRSVIRVFTLCSLDSSSTTQTTSSKKKSVCSELVCTHLILLRVVLCDFGTASDAWSTN